MAGWTLAEAQSKLTLWLAAEERIAAGQSYTLEVDGSRRTLQRADLKEVAGRVAYWRREVDRLTNAAQGRRGMRYLVN